MKEKTIHMIGNAHIDPVWLWRWTEGFHEVKATFRSALDRMKEYDDFVFTSSSAAIYEWIEQSDPQMFAEIKQRVAEGRWQITGGWWIEPDCNIPSGESFARQALYGQRYFQEKFGLTARVGYNVDSFGHHGMLPQLLKKSGLDYYVFMRPQPHEKGLPGRLFWWEGDDGSRVLAYRLPYEYCTWSKDLEDHVTRCTTELKLPQTESMCFYGVGNHGGGPTQENLDSILRMQADPQFPNLVFSSPEQCFKSILAKEPTLPVVHDELQHHASGCYAAHSGIKRWNRRAENLLVTAEKFAAIAAWTTGQPYPNELDRAWKNVLFNQFHDILAGTSLQVCYEDARDFYGEASCIASRGLNLAIQSLAWNIHVEQQAGVIPIVVFNPHAWESRVNVELELGRLQETDGLIDDNGHPVAIQKMQSQASANGRHRLSFIANLPPLGYTTYRLTPQSTQTDGATILASDTTLENDRFYLEIDTQTGTIKRLYDKQAQTEVFTGQAALPVVVADKSDTWSHNVFSYHQVEDCFSAREVKLVAYGPVKAIIRVTSEYGSSRFIQDFCMYRDLERIDVHVTVDWREQFKALKLRFPTNLTHMRATAEIPYGHVERFANGEEEPGQSWLDLSGMSRDTGAPYGLSLINDGKYSYDINIRDIGLTVLRSPIYAHHVPFVPEPDGHYAFIDQGIQEFNYTLLPHSGSWEQAGTIRRAAELNQQPIALIGTYHPEGSLPQSDSFVSVDRENILVSALKQAEDSLDLIVRCVETNKEATHATICLPKWNRAIEADYAPCEIKTFRIPKDHAQPVVETDLLERQIENGAHRK